MNKITYSGHFAVVSAGIDPIVSEILSFMTLEEKWCYGYGRPAPADSAINAMVILSVLRRSGFGRIEVFPDPSGGVMLSAFFHDAAIEILCKAGGVFDYCVERNNQDDEEKECVDEDTVLSKIWELSCPTQENISACYIQGSIVSNTDVFRAWHSKIHTTGSPWWNQSAAQQQVAVFANTLLGTIPTFQEIQPYTGGYMRVSSHQEQHSATSRLTPETTATSWLSEFQTAIAGNGFAVSL